MKRPSPAMAVAMLALFVALGGSAVAAKVLIRGSGQVRDGALSIKDLNKSARAQLGSATAFEAFRKDGPEKGNNETALVTQLTDLSAGTYAFFAKTNLTSPSNADGFLDPGTESAGRCQLLVEGDNDDARQLLAAADANATGTLNMQIVRSIGNSGDAELRCAVEGQTWKATNSSIIAIKVAATRVESIIP